ncbi:MAG TPA: DoxX family protein [Usitatibacteraceae bacterium]|nr:DoxX family protein [Usitatibacteraceae bacterium]
MIDRTTAPLGALLLRVSLGAMFIAHSVYLKAFVFTLPGTAKFFASLGLPGPLAYVVFAMEAIGGALLILGVKTRWVSIALVPVLAGAAWSHAGNGWLFTNAGGGWEYPVFLAIAAVVQSLVGDGAYALSKGATPAGISPELSRAGRYAL